MVYYNIKSTVKNKEFDLLIITVLLKIIFLYSQPRSYSQITNFITVSDL